MAQMISKEKFCNQLKQFAAGLQNYVSTEDGQWTVKGFVDVFRNVYTISTDTKVVSKIIEIHLFPKIMEFAERHGYKVVLADHQNYYPDISFVMKEDESIRFAVDFKTTRRNLKRPFLCNGFTLGSHGKYFEDRASTKNIQFPYASYVGHFCLGVIYSRNDGADTDELSRYKIDQIRSIVSVVGDFQFFATEKWKIASDKQGSGNTANIGSINNVDDILNENGMFSQLGESWFDDYWMNYGKITVPDGKGGTKKITALKDFVEYRKGDASLIIPKNSQPTEEDLP